MVKLKLFTFSVGLSFFICCSFVGMLEPALVGYYRVSNHYDGQLPSVTSWFLLLSPWLKYLGLGGLMYPAFAFFRKTVSTEDALNFFGIIFVAHAVLFCGTAGSIVMLMAESILKPAT
jgi:hypothetical protein